MSVSPRDMHAFKMPGYTGYTPGLQETYAKTPASAQLEVTSPTPESFIYTRDCAVPTSFPAAKDPKSNKPEPDVLWPALQPTATRGSLKPPAEPMVLGDQRLDVFRTTHQAAFKAPFAGQERLRSPNRNDDLANTTVDNLVDIYRSAYNRVGEARLHKIITTMRERLEAKVGSQNNAFKFRKLVSAYDKDKTGKVHVEDFRNMAEQFGMQLDDDSLLALFCVYDPEGTGYLVYHDLVKHLMDSDCYALYVNNVDVSAAKAEEDKVLGQLAGLQDKFGKKTADLESVLQALDSKKTGVLSQKDLAAGCASLGLVIGDKEMAALSTYSVADKTASHAGAVIAEDGSIHYHNFILLLKAGPSGVTKRTRALREQETCRSRPSCLTIPTEQQGVAACLSPCSPAAKRVQRQ